MHRAVRPLALLIAAAAIFGGVGSTRAAPRHAEAPQPPTAIVAPDDGAVVDLPVHLYWAAVRGATNYHLTLTDTVTGAVITTERSDRGTTIAPKDTFVGERDGLQPGHSYQWSVAACDTTGCSGQSPDSSFTVDGGLEQDAAPNAATGTVFAWVAPNSYFDFLAGRTNADAGQFSFDITNGLWIRVDPSADMAVIDTNKFEQVDLDTLQSLAYSSAFVMDPLSRVSNGNHIFAVRMDRLYVKFVILSISGDGLEIRYMVYPAQ